MRRLFAAVLGVLVLAGGAGSQEKARSLKVGDPAPPLKATKWLQGAEVKGFEKGKTYVVEFWATWCGPCIVMMPHLSDLQTQFKGKGLTVIGFSARDASDKPTNNLESVTAFVTKRGPKLHYTFAYADDRDTYNAYMTAAGRSGIPCTFVIDKDGRIAYVGHPMYLDLVLPKVVEGKWRGESDLAEVEQMEKEVNAVFEALGQQQTNPEAALKAITDFQAKRPLLANIPYLAGPKMGLQIRTKKFDEARKTADELMARAVQHDDPMALQTVAAVCRSPAARESQELVGLSIKAAEAGLKMTGDKDPMALLNVAESYHAAGDAAKAKDYGGKAIAAAAGEPEQVRQFIQRQVQTFDKK
jgi:thiol-disulfide isomerase/thioredoxin